MSETPTTRLNAALIGRYRIERELGAGGMATVYLAHDERHDRKIALKVLREDLAKSIGRDRFLREIRMAAKLSHPHILPLFDSGEAGDSVFYVMPSAEGRSLRDRLESEGKLSIEDAVRFATEIAGALEHAHRHEIVHRDIKPENIMLQDGHALVADFGIGKAVGDTRGETLTHAGMSVGTPAYMSPEQALGDEVDGRSDVYALGCVLYEMLVGEPPFTGPNSQAIIAKRFAQSPADVLMLREGIPRPVARALQRALQRTPEDRPVAAELIAALREVDAPRAAAPAQSIAVLPFTNLSADRDNEFFGDGIAEDVINALSRVEGLHVAARTSAFSFKGKQVDLREIGDKLQVATVLEGSVRRSGNRLRITAQLMAVADGYQLWSERYDRELVDIFAVQDEIAGAIAARLQLTFAKPAKAASRATTAEVEAYNLVVRARALTAQRGRAVLEAIDCLEKAIALDPNRVDAHTVLGNALRIKAQYAFATYEECLPRAYAALRRALEIAPDNAEAMGHLAALMVHHETTKKSVWRPLFERALEIDPRQSEVRGLYAFWALATIEQGREDEAALRELRRALADDQLNPFIATIFSLGVGLMGRPDEGAEVAMKACDADPGSFGAHFAAAWTLAWARRSKEALASIELGVERFGREPWLLHALTGVYMQLGDRRRAEAVHAELEARAITSRITNWSLAISACHLGHLDQAVEYAVRSAKANDSLGPAWYRWPDFQPIAGHPRFAEVRAIAGYY